MKTLVLYSSNTGSTKAYAEEIARRTFADIYPIKKFKMKNIDQYDCLIYGGWIDAGKITGIDEFLGDWDYMSDKDVIVFSVGMSYPSPEGKKTIIDLNLLNLYHLRYYQLQGNFDLSKLGFWMRKKIELMIKNTPPRNGQPGNEELLAYYQENPQEVYDQAKVDRIVQVVQSLEVEHLKKEADGK